MTELIIWKNREIDKMKRDVERLFDRMLLDFGAILSPGMSTLGPSLDISETEGNLIVKVELPGVDPENVHVSVTDRTLSLSGEKYEKQEKKGAYYHHVERRFGSFSRTIQLPCMVDVEKIEATFLNGVLMLVMPKRLNRNGECVKLKVT